MYCKNCGANIGIASIFCPNCGTSIIKDKDKDVSDDFKAYVNDEDFFDNNKNKENSHNKKQFYKSGVKKDKYVAGVLALTMGCFGAHHFYMGKIGRGIVDLIFFWSGIPSIVGFIMGIIYIVESEESFNSRIR